MQNQQNPLSKHFRQPAIYIKLPSNGSYWPENAVELGATGELPVYPMTTKDEVSLKTPDALLNGEGVVSVIHSCVPNIKDAWKMPSIDVDYVLIAIRIASYGHHLSFESKCPKCGETSTYQQDLRSILEGISVPNYDETFESNNLVFKFKPQKYFETNAASQVNFEEQKILQLLEDPLVEEETRRIKLKENVSKLLSLKFKTLTFSTESITTPEGTKVTDTNQIMEFYENASGVVIKSVQDKLNEFTAFAEIKPFHLKCDHCGHEYDSKFEFDYASFFATGF